MRLCDEFQMLYLGFFLDLGLMTWDERFRIGIWDLVLGMGDLGIALIVLGFRSWDFGLGNSDLGLGIWDLGMV